MLGRVITAIIFLCVIAISNKINKDDRIQPPYSTIVEIVLLILFVVSCIFLLPGE